MFHTAENRDGQLPSVHRTTGTFLTNEYSLSAAVLRRLRALHDVIQDVSTGFVPCIVTAFSYEDSLSLSSPPLCLASLLHPDSDSGSAFGLA